MLPDEYPVYPLSAVTKTLESLGFDDRAVKEIKLAHVYRHALDPDDTPSFLHGTAGHFGYVTLARLAHTLHHVQLQNRPDTAIFVLGDTTTPLTCRPIRNSVCIDLPAELFTEDEGELVLKAGEQELARVRVYVGEQDEEA